MCNKYERHSSVNHVSQQLKLCNIFIFGMAYLQGKLHRVILTLQISYLLKMGKSSHIPKQKYSESCVVRVINRGPVKCRSLLRLVHTIIRFLLKFKEVLARINISMSWNSVREKVGSENRIEWTSLKADVTLNDFLRRFATKIDVM